MDKLHKTGRKKRKSKVRAKRPTTTANQRAFLDAYSRCGVASEAAAAAGISRRLVYSWLDADPEFRADFDEAREIAIEKLESEVRRRAVDGVDVPVFHGGIQVGLVRKYSDNLLMFKLKAARPHVYRDNVAIQHGVDATEEKRPSVESVMMAMAALTIGVPPTR